MNAGAMTNAGSLLLRVRETPMFDPLLISRLLTTAALTVVRSLLD